MKKCKFIHTDNRFAAMIRVGLVAAALWTSVGLQAQVTGVIRDAVTEQPLMGVQVRTADYSASAITDSLGEYFINAPFASSVLIISAPDYATREIALQGRDRVEVSLYSSLFSSGYGNIESLSGSHRKTVSAQAANDASGFWSATPVSIDSKIQDLLGGDVRAIHRSGVSGIGTTLFIRGLNSLNASAQPLFIIDGVVWNNQLEGASIHEGYFSNPLANINVKDIESITVLKDGNTIYGSKGANGVILINTMRAKEKATRITANLTWGVNTVPDLPKMMSADQYRTYASNQAQGFLNYYNLTLSEDALLRAFPFMDNDPSKIT
ncbi:MAG: TonB-dependent receptor plug domain-containing protein, partial [Prevotella sp.]|nr:TonB-dependent receptor plug domain-containing protein [Prevotella sp.]